MLDPATCSNESREVDHVTTIPTTAIVPPLPGALVNDWRQHEKTAPICGKARRFEFLVRIGGDGTDDDPIGVTVSGIQATDGSVSDVGIWLGGQIHIRSVDEAHQLRADIAAAIETMQRLTK